MNSLLSGVGVAILFIVFERLGDGPLAVVMFFAAATLIAVALTRELSSSLRDIK